ncbi:MAG: Nif3-like dinuclear metal center hexameric protein [Actinobacteria bacterium]|nr:Nif3-like dinuclear metal center hexameric protein [Actinomycetota bacterium]
MILRNLITHLKKVFRESIALKWDRVGLQIGDLDSGIERIMVTLDIDDEVLEEAIRKKAHLIISHHPLIFDPINNLTDTGPVQKKVLRLVRENIAVYSAHTNYDIMPGGLNDLIVEKMGLKDNVPIDPASCSWCKFVVFVPPEAGEKVREAICGAGGGRYGKYDCCTFNLKGFGTFRPLEGASPHKGKIGNLSHAEEVRIECIVNPEDLQDLIDSVIKVHPYEEVAYDIYPLETKFEGTGTGRIGKVTGIMTVEEFLKNLKNLFGLDAVAWISQKKEDSLKNAVKKVAVVNGSANSLTIMLASLDCDLVVVGEIGYHSALEISESGKTVVMIGHGTSEKWAPSGMCNILEHYFKENEIDIEILKNIAGFTPWRYYIG